MTLYELLNKLGRDRRLIGLYLVDDIMYARFENEDDSSDDIELGLFDGVSLDEIVDEVVEGVSSNKHFSKNNR